MFSNILYATDLSENHFHMCQQAVKIANIFGSNIYILHVIETPPTLQIAQGLGFAEIDSPIHLQEDAKSVLSVMCESLNIPASQQFVEVGSIKHHLLNKSKELGCDLIIMGKHTSSHLPLALSNTAHSIIHEVDCDLMIIK